jgi:2-C-methyl-D-erythritol 4-phosphate cytidylyltransferase
MASVFALIPCGGTGSRAGAGLPKQYRQVAGNTVLGHTLNAFVGAAEAGLPAALRERLQRVVVVVSPGDPCLSMAQQAISLTLEPAPAQHANPNALFALAHCAGATRADTVRNGLCWLLDNGARAQDWVLVHDAARCLVTPAQINALVAACSDDPVGGLLAQPLADTLKQADPKTPERVLATLDRSQKWLAQTPQMFRIGTLLNALVDASAQAVEITDEASAMEFKGLQPQLVRGSAQNFKLTYPEDFALAEAVLQSRRP